MELFRFFIAQSCRRSRSKEEEVVGVYENKERKNIVGVVYERLQLSKRRKKEIICVIDIRCVREGEKRQQVVDEIVGA